MFLGNVFGNRHSFLALPVLANSATNCAALAVTEAGSCTSFRSKGTVEENA